MALALLAGGAWWVVRGPMVGKPMAAVPDVDLDSMASRPSDTTPSDVAQPGPARSVLAAVGAASVASGANAATCGEDGGPKFAEPEEYDGMWLPSQTLVKGATPGFIAGQARIDAALRGSADPFDRAAADLLNAGDSRTPSGSVDALVQQASSTQDPRVYGLAMRACESTRFRATLSMQADVTAPASCAMLDSRRWADLDPGNGVPWLWVLARANEARDGAGRREALARLAAARRFDAAFFGVAATVANHTAVEADGNAGLAMIYQSIADASLTFPPGVGLAQTCKDHAGGDETVAKQCAEIATTMFEHTDSLMLHYWAGTITFMFSGDTTRRDAARAELGTLGEQQAAAMPDASCAALRYSLKHFVRANEIGELAALREAASAPAKP